MTKQVFINLVVKDPQKSMDFYTALGFTNNPQFSDDSAKCMVWSEQVYLMLQTYEMYKSGNKKIIPDTKEYSIATFTLPVESLDRVNEIIEKASMRPELLMVRSSFDIAIPQYHTILDKEKAKSLGVSITDAYKTLQITIKRNFVVNIHIY